MSKEKNEELGVYRQGDVLFRRVAKIPANAKKIEAPAGQPVVIAYGERTGHMHRLTSQHVTAFTTESAKDEAKLNGLPNIDYIRIGGSGAVALKHEHEDGRPAEHEPVALPPGDYYVGAQVEYEAKALRVVSD